MQVENFYDTQTNTLTYLVYDGTDGVIIDPVLDFDQASVTTSEQSIAKVVARVKELKLNIHFVLETHAHADHLSGANQLIKKYFTAAKIGIGEKIQVVQNTFKKVFNLPQTFQTNGSQFGRLFKDQEIVNAGKLNFKVIFTPGHTPACVSYYFENTNAVFTGDALFMPDSGTGRCDFPDGSANDLYHSVHERLYALPDQTEVYVGHDYQPGGRPLAFKTTIKNCKQANIQLKESTSEAEYVEFRRKRDATLSAPRLLYPSVQVNIAAGELPPPEQNGKSYLKLPIQVSES